MVNFTIIKTLLTVGGLLLFGFMMLFVWCAAKVAGEADEMAERMEKPRRVRVEDLYPQYYKSEEE